MPRRPMDFYETSKEAVDALVEHYLRVEFHTEVSILEPCSGDGALARALAVYGYEFVWDKYLPGEGSVVIVPKRERQ